MIWISLVFLQGSKMSDEILLQSSSSYDMQLNLEGVGIGYYKITILEFAGDQVFIQILDENHNIIAEQNIHTKMSVGYFNFENGGTFTVKITNISENQIKLQSELGNTNSENMILPGVIILVGVVMLMVISYLKLRNYNTEQPEENIS
jgi:hypothetical protein